MQSSATWLKRWVQVVQEVRESFARGKRLDKSFLHFNELFFQTCSLQNAEGVSFFIMVTFFWPDSTKAKPVIVLLTTFCYHLSSYSSWDENLISGHDSLLARRDPCLKRQESYFESLSFDMVTPSITPHFVSLLVMIWSQVSSAHCVHDTFCCTVDVNLLENNFL